MAIKLKEIKTFRAFYNRDYSLLWIGQLGNSGSLWVEAIARNWLIWELTGSGVMLAIVNLLRALPMLFFGVFAGVAADRFNKKTVLLLSQTFTLANKLVLATLIITGNVEVWHVLLTAFLMGCSMVFEQPTRTSLIPGLVNSEELNSAIALNAAAMNVTRVIGPATAGLLLAPIGTGGVYFVAAGVQTINIITTMMIHVPKQLDRKVKASMWTDLIEGLKYVYKEKRVLIMILEALIPITLAWPYMTMLPMYADEVLNAGESGYGFLISFIGIGSLLSVIIIATISNVRRKGLVNLAAIFFFGLFLVLFSQSRSMPMALALMVIVGFTSTSTMVLTNTVLLTVAPPELHGRVMGVYRLDRGLMPLGTIGAGFLADSIGSPGTIMIMGLACVALGLIMSIAVPAARKID